MTRPIALITGASSGIGAEYARQLAPDHDLVLVARRADRLEALAHDLRAAGAQIEILAADLGTAPDIARVSGRLAVGDVRLLISNAGAGGYAPFASLEPASIDRLIDLNLVASIQLARAALPAMLDAGDGAIVLVASLLAFSAGQSNPRMPARAVYASAKAALVAFARLLAFELEGTGVSVQVVCPGVVATEFNAGAGLAAPSAMTPEAVVLASLAGIRLGETICVPGHEDQGRALDALLAAEGEILTGGFRPSPAARYDLPPAP